MSGNPRVSVVMSTYNDVEALPASIESVMAQSFGDFEFIIVNDGSSDNRTAGLLYDYARSDARIRVLTKTNAGLTCALIDGCAEARADFIARIDAGDRMLPERLRLQREILLRYPDMVLVSCWTEYCGPQWEPMFVFRGKPIPEEGASVLPEDPSQNLVTGPTHHGSVMFRRGAYETAGGYRREFYYGQDWDLWNRLAEQGLFATVPMVLYQARYLTGSISAVNRKRQTALGRLSREAMRLRRIGLSQGECLSQAAAIHPCRMSRASPSAEAGVCYMVGESLRRRGDARSLAYLKRAFHLRPWHVATWVRWAQAVWGAKTP